MYSTNEWYYFVGALDKKSCNKILNLAEGKWKESTVNVKNGVTDDEGINKLIFDTDKNNRISDIVWARDQWIYDIVWPIMFQANDQAGWKYDIRAAEDAQITRYKKGGYYQFHRDGMGDHLSIYNKPKVEALHGYVRKLSMTVLLNDNYEGGEFQFANYFQEKCTIVTPEFNKMGSVIVFPSDMEHRVAPVTKGTRYSLVTWFIGPPFV